MITKQNRNGKSKLLLIAFTCSAATNSDVAHELGHGVFGLEHTFPAIPLNSSNNLMDYANQTHLVKSQWQQIQKPGIILTWFDEEEDGSILVNSENFKKIYWSKSANDTTRNLCIEYGATGANIRLELKKSLKGKTVEIEINSQNGTKVRTSYLAITDDNLIQNKQLSLDKNEFILSDEDDVAKYVIKVKYLSDFLISSKSSALEAHAVIYLPAIMQSKGWGLAKSSQDDWFNGSGNNFPWDADPKINYFTFEKALENVNFNTKYNEIKNNYWQNTPALNLLRKRIKDDMLNDGNVTLPTQNNTTTFFYQINSYPIVTVNADHEEGQGGKAMEKMPICEKYYFQNYNYENSGVLDDFYASIANCNIRFVCNGKLEYKGVNNIEVTITTVGVYVKDGFDFVDDDEDFNPFSQQLGFWSIKDNDVSTFAVGPKYRLIDNDSYKTYRLKTKKGRDCYRYSTFKLIENLNFKFNL